MAAVDTAELEPRIYDEALRRSHPRRWRLAVVAGAVSVCIGAGLALAHRSADVTARASRAERGSALAVPSEQQPTQDVMSDAANGKPAPSYGSLTPTAAPTPVPATTLSVPEWSQPFTDHHVLVSCSSALATAANRMYFLAAIPRGLAAACYTLIDGRALRGVIYYPEGTSLSATSADDVLGRGGVILESYGGSFNLAVLGPSADVHGSQALVQQGLLTWSDDSVTYQLHARVPNATLIQLAQGSSRLPPA